MAKLTLTPKPIPTTTRESKNVDLYQEIATAVEALPIGECIEVTKDMGVPVGTIESKIRGYVKLKDGERLKISKMLDDAKKLVGIRLSKMASDRTTESQGTVKTV